jgi:hypothetical protein
MSAKNTAAVRMCLTPEVATNTLVPTAITSIASIDGKPQGVMVESSVSPKVGEVVKFKDVGFSSINNKSFVVTAVTASGFSIGNVILGDGTLSATPEIEHYADAEMDCICLSEFTISTAAPAVIDTSTYCGSSSIPSAKVEAGTAAAVGYVDTNDSGYLAILEAIETGKEYILRVTLGDNGYLVMPVVLSGMSYTLPLDGAQQYSFQFTFGASPKHVFA